MIGFGQRISYAFRSFFKLLTDGEIPDDVIEAVGPALPQPEVIVEKPAESVDRAIQILAILQRDGRLIDFFTEDISPYTDAQIGAAVRELQQSCKQSLERYIKLEPILASEEGQPVTVPETADPATVKLIGNVTGTPPLSGVLRHRGWRASQVQLPPLPGGDGRSVIAPAEVEIP